MVNTTNELSITSSHKFILLLSTILTDFQQGGGV